MTSAQVDKTLLTTTDNSPSQNYNIVITRVNQQYLHLKESERETHLQKEIWWLAHRAELWEYFSRVQLAEFRALARIWFFGWFLKLARRT